MHDYIYSGGLGDTCGCVCVCKLVISEVWEWDWSHGLDTFLCLDY